MDKTPAHQRWGIIYSTWDYILCMHVNQKGQKIREQKNIAMVCKLNTLEITLYAGLVICTLASGDKALKKACIQILKKKEFHET